MSRARLARFELFMGSAWKPRRTSKSLKTRDTVPANADWKRIFCKFAKLLRKPRARNESSMSSSKQFETKNNEQIERRHMKNQSKTNARQTRIADISMAGKELSEEH